MDIIESVTLDIISINLEHFNFRTTLDPLSFNLGSFNLALI